MDVGLERVRPVRARQQHAGGADAALLDKMQGAGVLQLAFGCGHSLALLRNGSVLAWGRNERRQLGLGPKAPAAVPFPVEVRLLREEEIVQVATSCVGSVAVHRNGSLLFWGANDDGQAAIGRTKDIHTPIVPPVFQPNEQGGDGVRFEDVALGRRHTLAMVRKTHEVYAWGFGERGSLGLGDASNRTSPMLVKTSTASACARLPPAGTRRPRSSTSSTSTPRFAGSGTCRSRCSPAM